MVDPQHKQIYIMTLGAGVKSPSHTKYIQNFCEFWKTCRKKRIPEYLIWKFPSDDVVLSVYIIDCCFLRDKLNVFSTVRLKLRSIDYVAQLCGIQQSWSDNPALWTLTNFCKRRFPGKGSDTLPVGAKLVIQIINYVLNKYVYYGIQLNSDARDLKNKWLIWDVIWQDPKRLYWYLWSMSILTVGVTGLRGAECYENPDKQYNGYGLLLTDITFYWKNMYTTGIYKSNQFSLAYDSLHHVRIRLRHSKSGTINKSVYLRIGRTNNPIEPAVILLFIYHLQKRELKKLYKFNLTGRYLFQPSKGSFKLDKIKRDWKRIISELGFIDGNRFRFHGLRKGFATRLQQVGITMSLIAFAGRWKLQAAIYRYLIHNQAQLLPLAKAYLYGKSVNGECLDLDHAEVDLSEQYSKGIVSIDFDLLKQFDKSCADPNL